MSHKISASLIRAFARRAGNGIGQATRRTGKRRLRVESLEDRAVPAIFTVTDLGDNGGVNPAAGDNTGTLRQAIVDANATADADEIVFESSLFDNGAVTINTSAVLGVLAAGGGLTITGPAADLLTVQRDPGAATAFRIFSSSGSSFNLSDFTISGGTAVAAGVLSQGTTNLDRMTITGNNAAGIVGALYVSGGQTVTIRNSVVSQNTGTQTGGIQVGAGATLNVIESTISDNTATSSLGGAIVGAANSIINITDSTISGNKGTQTGGIQISTGATLNITRSTLSGNEATATSAGAILAFGGSTVNITDSTISENTGKQTGGIQMAAGTTLNILRSTIADNDATAGAAGGILMFENSTVSIVDSTISGNTTTTVGGGIYIRAGTDLTIENSTISGNSAGTAATNHGGGIFVGGFGATPANFSVITVTDSVISGNTSGGNGAGIYVGAYSQLTLTGSSVTGNTAAANGGGISVRAFNPVTVTNSTISGNTAAVGGGIYFGYNGSFAMYGSTVSGNRATSTTSARGGGGIYFYGAASTVNPLFPNSAVIGNSTIANNISESSGGGILLNTFTGGLVLGNTTIVGNTAANTAAGDGGGGIAVLNTPVLAQVQMANTIVSGNTNANGPDILSNQTVVTHHSAIGSATGFTNTGGINNIPFGTDLKLGPLADNGGPTLTMAPQFNADPLQSSPLINAGDNVYGALVGPFDQLGSVHGRIVGSAVDIGAFEVQPPTVTVEQSVAQLDPTNGSIVLDVKFNVPVTGIGAGVFDIVYGGSLDDSGATLDLVQDPLDPTLYTLTITGLTGEGDVTVSLPQDAVVDGSNTGNEASVSVDNVIRFDNVAPTVTSIAAVTGQADPTNGSISFDVKFSEDVSFDFADVNFVLGTGLTGVPTGTVTQDPLDSTRYTVTVTGGLTGDGTLTASVLAGSVSDTAGNASTADSASASVGFDNIQPSATISLTNPLTEQGGTSVSFTFVFSEPVANFDGSQISFAGSTAVPVGAQFSVNVSTTDNQTFIVTVGGVATGGDIIVNLPAGAVSDAAGNLNSASTIISNSILFHPTGTLQFTQPAVTVSEQGGTTVTFTVTRVGGTDGTLTVNYAVTGGDATLGSDYTFTPGTLTFAPGDTQQTFTVTVNDDNLIESDETLVLTLSDAAYDDGSGAVPLAGILEAPISQTLTITDFEEGTFDLSSPTYVGTEGGADISVVITRSNGAMGAATVDLTIAAGSADAADIGAALGAQTISFADGETSKTVTISIADDGLSEGDETILLSLSNPVPTGVNGNASLGTVTDAVLTIAKSDPVVVDATSKFTKKFTDVDQDTVTVKLTGSKVGTMNVYLDNQTPASLQGPISLIDLVGTDANGTLSIAVAKAKKTVNANADGVATIGGVSAPALKSLSAAKVNLDGAFGPGVNIAGGISTLTLGNVLNGADIAAGTAAKATKVTLGAVGNGSDVTINNAISTFTATSFGDGTITANSATSITTKGNAKANPANLGDFGADVILSGAGVALKKTVLGSLKVAGSLLASADITVNGPGGGVAGNVGTVTVGTAKKGSVFAGSLTADSVKTITVNGDLTGDITVTGVGVLSGKPALGKLAVKGSNVKGVGIVGGTIDGATIHVGSDTQIGNVTSVTAVNFLNSEFFAGYTGAPDGSGAFNTAGGQVGTFTVTDTFANSNAVASAFKKVSIKNVTTLNPTSFGLFAKAFTTIKIVTPAITAASATGVDQFFVKVV